MPATTFTMTALYARLAWLHRLVRHTTCPTERSILQARGLLATRTLMRRFGLSTMFVLGRPVTFNGVSR